MLKFYSNLFSAVLLQRHSKLITLACICLLSSGCLKGAACSSGFLLTGRMRECELFGFFNWNHCFLSFFFDFKRNNFVKCFLLTLYKMQHDVIIMTITRLNAQPHCHSSQVTLPPLISAGCLSLSKSFFAVFSCCCFGFFFSL